MDISKFLPAIGNWWNGQVNQAANSILPQVAIPTRIAQNPGKFVQNAATDAGNLIKGSINLLPAIGKSVMQGTEGQDLGNAAKAVGQGYKSIAQDPYGSFINNPVSTALSITPLGGPLSKISKGSDIAKAGVGAAKGAGETNTITDMGNRFLRSQYSSARPSTIENFTPEHLNQLANYGITQPKQVIQAHDIVTGENGIAPKIIRGAIAKANPIDTGGLENVAQSIIDHTYGQTDRDAAQFVKNTAVDFANKVPNKPVIDATGNIINTTTKDPLETYQFAQDLRKTANQLTNSPNEAKRAMGQAYNQFISEIDDRLYNKSGANDILNNSTISPSDIQRVSEGVSPQFAQELQNAAQNGTIHDMKHLQQPFVTGNQAAVEASKLAKSSPMSIRNALAVYLAGQGNPVLGGAIIMGNTAGGQNLIGKGLRALGGDNVANSSAGLLPTIKTGAKIAGNTVKTALPPIIKGNEENNYKPQNKLNEPHIGATIASTPPVVNSIPTSQDQITPDKSGHLGVYDSFGPNGVASSSLKMGSQISDLNNQIGQLELDPKSQVQYSPEARKLAQLQVSLKSLEDQYSLGQSQLAPGQKAALSTSNIYNSAYDMLKNADPNILSSNDTYDKLKTITTGPYAKLALYAHNLEQASGVPIFVKGMDKNVLQQNLLAAAQTLMWKDYYAGLNTYTGGTQPSPTTPTPQPTGNTPLPSISPSSDANQQFAPIEQFQNPSSMF